MGNRSSKGPLFGRARAMGRRRGERDARARSLADAFAQGEHGRRAVCLQRWPGILAAIRSLVAAYNEGAGAEVLTTRERPTATIRR